MLVPKHTTRVSSRAQGDTASPIRTNPQLNRRSSGSDGLAPRIPGRALRPSKAQARLLPRTPVSAPSRITEVETAPERPTPSKPSPSPSKPSSAPSQGLSVLRFLDNRVLFVTGATGFLAKVLVEKILREQPNVGRLYLLVQPRRDQTPSQRLLDAIRTSPLFDRLRERHGEQYEAFMTSKLVAVGGNLTREGMGVEPAELSRLAAEVEVVVNSAASTSFDERYDAAVRLNTLGALECARFAGRCTRLQSLVHVSTAFVNGYRQGPTDERPFDFGRTVAAEMRGAAGGQLDVDAEVAEALAAPQRIEARLVASGFAAGSPELDQAVERELVAMGMQRAQRHGWQDTYVFTKSMGEMLLRREVERLGLNCCCIVRPSIVESTLREPMPGWIEGLRMSDPIIIAYGKGQMVGFAGDRNGVLDVVPCDLVINACLAAMTKHALCNQPGGQEDRASSENGASSSEPITVYHVATSTANPLNIRRFVDIASAYFRDQPMQERGAGGPVRVDPLIIYDGFYSMFLDSWRRYALPWQVKELRERLAFWDKSRELTAEERKQKLIQQKVYEQLTYLASIYVPYTFYAARFSAKNTEALEGMLVPEERGNFTCDLRAFSWEDYLAKVHIPGLRKFVLKGRA